MNFLENFSGKNNPFWKYLVTFVVAFIAAGIIGGIPLLFVIIVYTFKSGVDITKMTEVLNDPSIIGISQNLLLLLMLFTFTVGLFATIWFIHILHRRSFSETVNGTKRVRWQRVFTGFGVWSLLMFVSLMVYLFFDPENYTLQFEIKTFIPLLFISLIFIPLQTTFEELLFRGYLAQGIGAWTKNRWLVVIIPSILFGLMHYANTEVETYGFYATIPSYILYGLLLGFISVIDDGIELAMGLHAANNIFGCLFVSFDTSSLQTPAIFHQQNINIPQMYIEILLLGLIAFIFFAKKYKWNLAVLNQRVRAEEVCD